jgi:p-aminobenzoyl-glutamate transporter AbgT
MTSFAAIDWAALGQAAWVSVVIGLGVLLIAAVAVTSSLRAQDARGPGGGSPAVYGAVTVLCVIALAAAIVIGIYIMTDK